MSAAPPSARVTYLGHATVAIEDADTRLLTDPLLRGHLLGILRRRSALADPAAAVRPDAILISHIHRDHLDLPTLRRFERSTPIVGPRGCARLLRRRGFDRVIELAEGESTRIGRALVSAVPARHRRGGRPGAGDVGSLGYVIEGASRIYFAGDTDLFDGMREIGERLDLALLPVGGWGPTLGAGHLDPERAAEALRLLRPRIAVPIHWGTYTLLGSSRLWPWLTTDPGRQFADRAAQLAPEVDVRVLEVGEGLNLDGGRERV